MEKGDNVRQIIERFAMATQQIQVCLKEQGYIGHVTFILMLFRI